MFGGGAGMGTGADGGGGRNWSWSESARAAEQPPRARTYAGIRVPRAIAALTSITCGSARSSRQRHATLARSAAVTIVELLSQFAQPVRSSA